jgi:hypothetical protein
MGIRDTLKSLRGGEKNRAEEDITAEEAPEPTWFQPRFDGIYVARSDSADQPLGVSLRFMSAGKVFEYPLVDGKPLQDEQNPCRGEYTAAGRFNVQRRFERIISYAVLEMEPDGFLARRINAADRSTVELHFVFQPDISPAAGPG